MASNYYLYNPADNLALAQAILLANSDRGMSYIIPYEEKSNNSPAQNGLTILETIDKALGAITPRNNADLASLASLPNSNFDFAPVKEMIKRSVQQAPPAGWQAADVDDPASQFTVLSVRGTPELKTSLFEAGAWRDADTGTFPRGNPYVAYGGTITDAVFVDFAGHFNQTPGLIGEQTVSKGGRINSGTLYENSPGDIITAEDNWNPVHGLTIDATGKDVTLVNFSVTSQGFAPSRGASDDLAFRSYAEGVPLKVRNGDVTLSGDVVIDQVTQVVFGNALLNGAIDLEGSGARVTFDQADVYLGAVRGYESLIHASNNTSLQFKDSTIYGFASSNSTAPNLPSDGLLWADFENKDAIGIQHLISIDQGASAGFSNTTLLREEPWTPQGAEYQILNETGRRGNWDGNDYDNISEGEIYVGSGSDLTIENSTIFGSIVVRPGAGNVSVKDSQIAGNPVGGPGCAGEPATHPACRTSSEAGARSTRRAGERECARTQQPDGAVAADPRQPGAALHADAALPAGPTGATGCPQGRSAGGRQLDGHGAKPGEPSGAGDQPRLGGITPAGAGAAQRRSLHQPQADRTGRSALPSDSSTTSRSSETDPNPGQAHPSPAGHPSATSTNTGQGSCRA